MYCLSKKLFSNNYKKYFKKFFFFEQNSQNRNFFFKKNKFYQFNIIILRTLYGFTLPVYGFLFFLITIILFILWFQYCKYLELFVHGIKYATSLKQSGVLLYLLLDIFLLYFTIFFFYFFYFLKIFDFSFKILYLSNLIVTQLFVFSLFYFLFLYIVYNKIIKNSSYQIDFGIFIIFVYIIGIWMLTSNNLLNLFILLEILNLLVIYSFIITIQFNYLNVKFIPIKSFWLVNACTYQFLLNFFSSIFFYITFNIIISYTFSSNFWFLRVFDFSYLNIKLYFSLLYLSFLIKFGVGPWIFFKLEIYKNFNYMLLMFYTIIYFLVLLTFFFNLFFIYFLPLDALFLVLTLIILIAVFVYFTSYIYSYYNLFIFFSYSSLLNFFAIMFQWVAISYILVS